MEIGHAMCEHLPVASDWIHGGGWGRREERETNRNGGRSLYCSIFPCMISRGTTSKVRDLNRWDYRS
jgi:hypothetical protein